MDPTDATLLEAWAHGDARAGEALFERHFVSIARFFHNKIDRDHDDLVQRTFLGVLEARSAFRADSSFRAFLFGIARNVLGKHLRTKYRDPQPLDLAQTSIDELGASPSHQLAADENQHLMLQALRRIPVEHQVILELYFWESLTTAEIGQLLEVPLGTAKTRLRRAKQLLAGELSDLMSGVTGFEPTHTRLETWARGVRAHLEGLGDPRGQEPTKT